MAHQVREEEHRALQHADQHQVLARVVARDLRRRARATRRSRSSAGTRISPIASSSVVHAVSSLWGVGGLRAARRCACVARSAARPVRRPPARRCGRSSIAVPCSDSAAISSARRARPRAGPPTAPSASRCTTSRRSAGGSARRRAELDRAAPGEHLVDERVEHLASSRSSSASASTFASAPGWTRRKRRHQPARAPARARTRRWRCSRPRRQLSPRSRAVRGRLLAREARAAAGPAPLARAHPEQRPAARRGREPVEDRLDLVGGGVAGGHVGAARRAPARAAAAVALRRAPTPGGCPSPARRGRSDLERARRAARTAPRSGARRRRPRRAARS